MSDHIRPPVAGWYPDPGGQPGQRYHDGLRWTQHFAPTPPSVPPPPAPAVAVAVSTGGGTNHGLHAVLTLLSCGLWLPIWILPPSSAADRPRRWPSAVRAPSHAPPAAGP